MPIRLDPNPLPNLLVAIQQDQANLNTATQQLSTGRNVNQLSDNPAAVAALVSPDEQKRRTSGW